MTLTQLNAFVLVARLGSVRAAASALGVSESAVSQALTALRQDLGDQLITRSQAGMTLTPGGTRLLGTASQIVVLGAEAHAAVRAAQGAPEQLRIVATSTFAEFVAGPLLEAFRRRFAGAVEITTGVAAAGELPVLIANRLADGTFPSIESSGSAGARSNAKRCGDPIEQLRAMPPAEARRLLMQLPGIGDYSADIINPHGGFPIDAWSVEVFSQLFYAKVPARNRDSIEKVKREGLRRWGRWAWLAFFYVVQDLPRLSDALGVELRLE